MAKPTSLRTCKSIGSRTRSKRPDAPTVAIPANGKVKKKQTKLKVKRTDNAAATESKGTEAKKRSTNADEAKGVKDAEKVSKRHRVSESPQISRPDSEQFGSSNRIAAATSKSDENNATVKPEEISTAAAIATTQSDSATSSKAVKLPTDTKHKPTETTTAIKLKETPRQNSIIRRRNITPSPTLSLASAPAFPTKWQGLSHKTTSTKVPPGVTNLSLHPHFCCPQSSHSHRGYSWLSSQQRCGCTLDSDHNTSESLSEVYLGHYGVHNQDWKTEKWLLDCTQRIKDGTSTIDNQRIEHYLDYLPRQTHLNANMRAILMDWMVEMSMEYGLHAETVYLSVVLVDRALACAGYGEKKKNCGLLLEKDKLQCVGCACTLIASKLLEITPPTVQDFCYISDNSYTVKEILECEAGICSALRFNFNYGTTYKYVDHFLRASFATPNGKVKVQKKMMEWMIFYFLDLSLLDYKFVGIKPSLVAAAAVYLARATLGIREVPPISANSPFIDPNAPMFQSIQRCSSAGFWTKTLQHYTGYDKWDLEEPVKMLRRLHENAESNHLKSVYTKFKSEAFGKVAFKTVLNEDDLGFF